MLPLLLLLLLLSFFALQSSVAVTVTGQAHRATLIGTIDMTGG
jgi:hypothetical protein